MASSPTTVSQPAPLRTPEGPSPDLHHPIPDLQSLQGAYVGNIERLEDTAERMSEHGSDLGEEIRRLQLEQKLTDSRRASLRSAEPTEEVAQPFGSRSRGASTSSYANSIVDVNGAARWGGYSPGGYMNSPGGSLLSGPAPHQVPLQRQRSGSRASRLGQVVHAEEQEEGLSDEEPGSPQSHKSLPRSSPSGPRKVSSFTRRYDQIAHEIQEGLQSNPPNSHEETVTQGQSGDQLHPTHLGPPDRPPTAFSTDTTYQARTLWQDFDGEHCADSLPEEGTLLSASRSRNSSLMQPSLPIHTAPPPADGMVFYPAPVPQMLTLPKRLSKVPAANVQARRRTQLLESMHTENRKSAPWLPDAGAGAELPMQTGKGMDPRKSRQSLANLPPQLRASAYFDQIGPAQEFTIKGESAADTLDSILEASARAPVTAFTDHPFAGHVGDEVYGKERHEQRASKLDLDKLDARKSRSSLNLLDTRRNSSGDLLKKLKKRNSSADLNTLTVRATESRVSLGDELDEPDRDARGPEPGDDIPPQRGSVDGESAIRPNDQPLGDEEDVEEEERYFGPPTTLLAELQMRKAQQKNRNLTAATAFPNGMHATLLELDAVAEIEKKKRKSHKVNLAWEAAPPTHPDEDDSDDDVPLGVLFPGRDGLVKRAGAGTRASQWGPMAHKDMDDGEPLSRRRNRLLGGDSNQRRTQYLTVPTSGSPQPPPSEEEEIEGETLAQRIRRLKSRQTLDNALDADIRKSSVGSSFAAEIMGQFGMKEDDNAKPMPSPRNDEEETLGQRRARLQAEALARGDTNPQGSRPPLRASMSMSNILSAHPIDTTDAARRVSDEKLLSSLPRGSLLHQNAVQQSRREVEKANLNRRISSYNALDQPLVGNLGGKVTTPEPQVGAKIQAYKDRLAGAGTPRAALTPSVYYTPMGGMTPAMSMMNLTAPGQRESYFPQANMGMAPPFPMNGMAMTPNTGFTYPGNPQQMMAMNMGMMGMPLNGMQGVTNPYQQMAGMRQSSMINLPTLQMQQQAMMMAEPPMDPRQRDMIDQWRNGISH